MRYPRLGSFLLLLAGVSGAAAQNSGTCAAPIVFSSKSGTELTIESRSGEIDLVGSDKDGIRVDCNLEDLDHAQDVRIQFEQTGDFARLLVRGGSVHNLKIHIEVPRRTNFKLRVPAGQVKVDQVSGDKDIALAAGQIVVSNVTGAEYRSVDASVGVGEVRAQSFGIEKGGFFRKFSRESPGGHYRLRAHLISGSVELN